MNEIKAVLRPLRDASGRLVPHIYESIHGGLEPLFRRSVERGEVQFGHQSGYGYLPANKVEVRHE